MPYRSNIYDFLVPIDYGFIHGDEDFLKGQLGHSLMRNNDLDGADLVLIGCCEYRGQGESRPLRGADRVRKQLYRLYHWHADVQVADLGNIMVGDKLSDSYAALESVIKDLVTTGKKVMLLGGSHDNTIAIYRAFASR
ncbi:MAG TPA: arginase family protein, partial [Phnomibacter sp.]|nr:arginase family protein [Phnomibacter sp.]